MSDRAHRRQPATLPEGYQYGDARPESINPEGATFVHEGLTYVLGPPMVFEDDIQLREFRERYVRPAVEHDPLGTAVLLFGENALKVFNPYAPSLVFEDKWRAPHENAAEQLKRQAEGFDVAGEVTREDRIQRTGDETI